MPPRPPLSTVQTVRRLRSTVRSDAVPAATWLVPTEPSKPATVLEVFIPQGCAPIPQARWRNSENLTNTSPANEDRRAPKGVTAPDAPVRQRILDTVTMSHPASNPIPKPMSPVSYTHLRAHETVLDLVCRLLLE